MKFSVSLVAALASIVSAVPQPLDIGNGVTLTPREPRAHLRGRSARGATSLPKQPVASEDFAIESLTNDTNESYSSNWAGAVLIGSGYNTVTGTFTVPTPKVPTGGSSSTTYAASGWVGIDGDTCQTAILQTGIDFYVRGSTVSFDAWYEWYPDYAYTFSGFSISAGNSIRLTATVTSKTAGTVKVENLSTGKTVTHSFTGQTGSLCQTNAEWIVEDFSSGGSLVPFANFGTVTFTGASAGGSGVSGATLIDIKQNNKIYTQSTIASSSSVVVKYIG